jgi:hypothetical protein
LYFIGEGTESLNNLPKVTEPVRDKTKIHTLISDPDPDIHWELIAHTNLLSVPSAIFLVALSQVFTEQLFKYRRLLELLLPPPAAESTPLYIMESLWHGLQSFPYSVISNLDLRVVRRSLWSCYSEENRNGPYGETVGF